MSYVIADINDCFQKSGRSFFPDEVPGSIQLQITITRISSEASTILPTPSTQVIMKQPGTVILGGQEFKICYFKGRTDAGILYQPIRLSSSVPFFVIKNNTLIEAGSGKLTVKVLNSGTPQAASLETAVEGFGCTLKSPSSEYESNRLIRQEDLDEPSTQSDSYVSLYYNKNYIKVTRVSESTAIPYLPKDKEAYTDADSQIKSEFGQIPPSMESSSKTCLKCAVGETVLIETIRSARNTRLWSIEGKDDDGAKDQVYIVNLYQDENGYGRPIDQAATSYYYTVQSSIYDEYMGETYTVSKQYIYFYNPTYKVSVSAGSDMSSLNYTNVLFSFDDIDYKTFGNYQSPTVGSPVWLRFDWDVVDEKTQTVSDFFATAINVKTGEPISFTLNDTSHKIAFTMPAHDVLVLWNLRIEETEPQPQCIITVKEDVNYLGPCLHDIKVVETVNSKVFEHYQFPASVNRNQKVVVEWEADPNKYFKYAMINGPVGSEMLQYDNNNHCSYEVSIRKDAKEITIIISSYCDAIILDLTTVPRTNVSGSEVKKLIDQHPTLWGMSSEGYVKAPAVFFDGLFRRLYLLPSEPITRTPSCLDSKLNVINPLAGGAFRDVHKKGIPDSCTCYLPNTITTIDDNSFRGSHLQFVLPESVTYIGHGAFHGNKLTSFMKLPDNRNLKFLSHNTFEACYKLKGVAGGNSLKYISQQVGYKAQLDYVFIPENADEVGYESFIQTGVNSKEWTLFSNSGGIYAYSDPKVIVWNAVNCTYTGTDIFPSYPKIIIFGPNVQQVPDSRIFCKAKTWVFQGSTPPKFLKNSLPIKVENLYYPSSAASSYSNFYPDITKRQGFSSLEDIFIYSLEYTTSDKKAVWPYRLDKCDQVPLFNTYTDGIGKLQYVLPITNIGDWQFAGLTQLTGITLPNTIKSIGAHAFSRCGLTSLTIPSSVTYISNDAFEETGITSLTWNVPNYTGDTDSNSPFGPLQSKVTSLVFGTSVETVPPIFNYFKKVKSITLPKNIISLSSTFAGWESLQSVTWNIVDHADFSQYYGPFKNNHSTITQFIFGSNVKRIPANLCEGLYKITSITIPNSVTSIGKGAFYQCKSLTSITIPNSVTSIEDSAFWECEGLTSATIGNGVKSIGKMAFIDCTSLTSVTLGNSVTSIGYGAFLDCSSLTSITIPNSVTSIGTQAFKNCYSLTSVTIGESVTSIENSAFSGCSSLASVTIGNSVTSIGKYTFENCSSLVSVTIPNSVTSIGNSAFIGCTFKKSNFINHSSLDAEAYDYWGATIIP